MLQLRGCAFLGEICDRERRRDGFERLALSLDAKDDLDNPGSRHESRADITSRSIMSMTSSASLKRPCMISHRGLSSTCRRMKFIENAVSTVATRYKPSVIMNNRLRPHLSVSRPKKSAPSPAPIQIGGTCSRHLFYVAQTKSCYTIHNIRYISNQALHPAKSRKDCDIR